MSAIGATPLTVTLFGATVGPTAVGQGDEICPDPIAAP